MGTRQDVIRILSNPYLPRRDAANFGRAGRIFGEGTERREIRAIVRAEGRGQG